MKLDEKGREILSSKPLRIPVGFEEPEPLADMVRRLIRTNASVVAAEAGMETFEEANDFDIEDDPVDPHTPYETFFDPALGMELTAADVLEQGDELARRTTELESSQESDREPELFDESRPPEDKKSTDEVGT